MKLPRKRRPTGRMSYFSSGAGTLALVVRWSTSLKMTDEQSSEEFPRKIVGRSHHRGRGSNWSTRLGALRFSVHLLGRYLLIMHLPSYQGEGMDILTRTLLVESWDCGVEDKWTNYG
jgi:hypothetical protein